MRAGTLLKAARNLGAGPARTFLGVALLEAVNHVGAAEFLGVRTLTVPEGLLAEAGNTVPYAGLATALTVTTGLLVAAAPGLLGRRAARGLIRAAGLGYAMPGTVLAVGLLAPLALLDSTLAAGLGLSGTKSALVGLGSGAALVIAYALRFLTIPVGATEVGLACIPASLPDAARILGLGRLATLLAVEMPLAWPAVLSGALLVFVDIAKELPVTLVLRPLNVETLSTNLYGEAARSTYEDGAAAALLSWRSASSQSSPC